MVARPNIYLAETLLFNAWHRTYMKQFELALHSAGLDVTKGTSDIYLILVSQSDLFRPPLLGLDQR